MSHTQKHPLPGSEHDLSALNEGTVQVQVQNGVKSLVSTPFSWHGGRYVGEIIAWPTTTPPAGCLLCDGSAVSRTEYSGLFAVIGTTFGTGDGTTTFNLPDYRGRFLEGTPSDGTVGTSVAAGLPEIAGTIVSGAGNAATGVGGFRRSTTTGAFAPGIAVANVYATGGANSDITSQVAFSAAASNSIYSNSETVQPPASCVNYVIVAL